MWHSYASTPIGSLLLVASDEGLLRISFERGGEPAIAPEGSERADTRLRVVAKQLREYFDGKRRKFDVPLAPRGTPFQLEVWNALRQIPYGDTRSYMGIAQSIGRPAAVRAVGAANGANPIPIIIPCHRVIGSNGSLTGFGGGIDVKRRLLDLEGSPRLF